MTTTETQLAEATAAIGFALSLTHVDEPGDFLRQWRENGDLSDWPEWPPYKNNAAQNI